jgi:hypothetical protein
LYRWRCRCGKHLSEMYGDGSIDKSITVAEIHQAALLAANIVESNLSIDTLLKDLAFIVRPGSLSPARLRFGIEDRVNTIPWLAAASAALVGTGFPHLRQYSQFLKEKQVALTSGDPQRIEAWRRNYTNPFPWHIESRSNIPQRAATELYSKPSYVEAIPKDFSVSNRSEKIDVLLSPRDVARLLKIRTRDVYRLTELELLVPKNIGVRSIEHWVFDWDDVYGLIASISKLHGSVASDDTVSLIELIQNGELVRYNCDPALILSAVLQKKIATSGQFEHIYEIKLSYSQARKFGTDHLLYQCDNFSFESVGAILCVSKAIVAGLARAGYLELTRNQKIEAPRAAHIPLESLKGFTGKYILLSPLVALNGSSSRSLANKLASLGIERERMPPGTKRTILVYRRSDLLVDALLKISKRHNLSITLSAIRDPFAGTTS